MRKEGRVRERKSMSTRLFAGGVDVGKGGDRYALDGFTKGEIDPEPLSFLSFSWLPSCHTVLQKCRLATRNSHAHAALSLGGGEPRPSPTLQPLGRG